MERYSVVLLGFTRGQEWFRGRMMRQGAKIAQVEKIIAAVPCVLKQGLVRDEAERLAGTFRECGGEVEVRGLDGVGVNVASAGLPLAPPAELTPAPRLERPTTPPRPSAPSVPLPPVQAIDLAPEGEGEAPALDLANPSSFVEFRGAQAGIGVNEAPPGAPPGAAGGGDAGHGGASAPGAPGGDDELLELMPGPPVPSAAIAAAAAPAPTPQPAPAAGATAARPPITPHASSLPPIQKMGEFKHYSPWIGRGIYIGLGLLFIIVFQACYGRYKVADRQHQFSVELEENVSSQLMIIARQHGGIANRSDFRKVVEHYAAQTGVKVQILSVFEDKIEVQEMQGEFGGPRRCIASTPRFIDKMPYEKRMAWAQMVQTCAFPEWVVGFSANVTARSGFYKSTVYVEQYLFVNGYAAEE